MSGMTGEVGRCCCLVTKSCLTVLRPHRLSPTPLQCFCLENPMDGGAWWAAVHGIARVRHDWVTLLSLFTFMHWRRKWQSTPGLLPGKSHGQRSLVGYSPWGCKQSDTTERLHYFTTRAADLLLFSSTVVFLPQDKEEKTFGLGCMLF